MSSFMVNSYVQAQNSARAYKALQNRNNPKTNNAANTTAQQSAASAEETTSSFSLSSLLETARSLFTQGTLPRQGEAGGTQNVADFARQNAQNMGELKQAAFGLGNSARSIGRTTLESPDESVASISADFPRDDNLSYNIEIQNLAEPQEMESEALVSDASGFVSGSYGLELATDAGTFDVSFDVRPGDTNLEAYTSAAESINSSGANVTADVINQNGTSRLHIQANETGITGGFDMRSMDDGRTAAEKMSLRETREPREANYTVNRQQFISDSNTVALPAGRGATMEMNGPGFVSVGSVLDTSGVVASAQEFASSYNSAVSHLATSSGSGAAQAISMISGSGGAAQARLAAMGISVNKDGMEIDGDKLKNAMLQSPDAVKDALSGRGSVSENVEQGADEAMRMPSSSFGDFGNSLLNRLLPQSGFLIDYSV